MKRYISREGEQAVRQFKYKGGDLSISYEYLWSPLAEKVLKFIPPTFAPNAITLTAFIIHSLTTIIFISFTPFTSPAPSWMLFLYGLSLFIYQTLDNVDGKQARKLQNSTPLGMIMDHGCDALSLLFCAASVARILCVSNFTLLTWTFTVGVTFSFYISAWCQYYSNGVMILGKINAVDDGIPGIWILAFYSAIFGQDLWLTPIHLFGNVYLLNEVILFGIIIAGISKSTVIQFRPTRSCRRLVINSPKMLAELF
jgi:ethanolaminephosphotransferase